MLFKSKTTPKKEDSEKLSEASAEPSVNPTTPLEGITEEIPATPVQKPKGLFSFGKQKKSTESSEQATVDKETKTGKPSMFSWFSKSKQNTSAEAKAAKPSEKEKKGFFGTAKPSSSKPKKSGFFAKSNEFYFLTELDNGKELFWKLTADDLLRAEEGDVQTWGTFSSFDLRFKTPKTFKLKDCMDLAMSEEGEFVHIINATSDLRVFYATRTIRPETKEYRIGPAQLLVDYALSQQKIEDKARVILVNLKGTDNSVVVLYAMSDDGETRKPQITLNPENIEFVISQFMATRKLDKSKTEVITLSNQDLLQVSSYLKLYPNEPQMFGIPVRKVQSYGLAGTFLLAIAGGGALGYSYYTLQNLNTQIAQTKKGMTDTQQQISQKISTGVFSFSKAMSLDYKASFKKAATVWVQDSYVELKSDYLSDQFIVHMQFNKNTVFGNRPSSESILSVDTIRGLLDAKLTDDCERSDISLTGALNEFQVTINCKNTNSNFSDFRNK